MKVSFTGTISIENAESPRVVKKKTGIRTKVSWDEYRNVILSQ
ncbi:hypothetical protein Mal48_13680 [Thalassoglobus polymorphus]|uniref:Uncharacterized protein n=1 Tax=Thalassoglobus polymorphus TaxID=2527994 RepID=A0A517QKG1_9PLAN|nr:hypothetical protein Mal48_13680 [Thalassoglobus polymorphus]